ncbi:protein MEI2-like 5 isoform X2 [Mercurialis annua]|uniref:protein MEI2-like 5 isoform X2 n=1 Tax=Mercurialis annua TaxID=3986 RepID=UPI0021609E1F|nr:protein MEI2-like 5 isoform X2 [Mercurialis annua]
MNGDVMKQFSIDNLSSVPAMSSPVNISKEMENGALGILDGSDSLHAPSDAVLFSTSLPVLPHEKYLVDTECARQSIDDSSSGLDKLGQDVEGGDLFDDVEAHPIGSLLPNDEDQLLAGIMDDFDLTRLPSSLDDLEDYDLFGSGGGMELENDPQENLSIGISNISLSDGIPGNGNVKLHYGLPNGGATVAGEHPLGEHPSRTLFVRNINSNVEDIELKTLFEQFGDIRTLYTACKHRGFVMISYYDIRAARTALRALQNKPLRRRKLDIHFSIPKDNPSDKDINQGTLVVFNLDPSVSNEELRIIFEEFGQVKEIRETPHKKHHKFIEYYDVRSAELALKALNRRDIAGKRIKLEPSRPGGARRNLILQLNQELELDEPRSVRQPPVGSPVTNPSPVLSTGNWAQFSSSAEYNPLQSISKSPVFQNLSPTAGNHLAGLASILHSQGSNSAKVAPIGKDQGRGSLVEHTFTNMNSAHGSASQQSHSLPESNLNHYHGSMSSFSGRSSSNGSVLETLSGPQFLWGSPKPYSLHNTTSAWPTASAAHPVSSNAKSHGFSYAGQHSSIPGYPQNHHHIGSAPSRVPLERHFGFFPESPETTFRSPVAFGGMGLGQNDGSFMMNMSGRASMNNAASIARNMSENGSSSYRMISSPRLSPVFLGNGPYPGVAPSIMDGFTDRGRSRRVENNGNQVESKKQFQLNLDKIMNGEDTRTTLMIKNIPNKYTSKMLLAAIDENHKGSYDFLYLPIDFKNKCNVGYAFINMLSPLHIIPFYEAFNGKKWEKFNSEKVASLAYGRIQGKVALVTHFQNSSLMNEDKRCRPILFQSEGQEDGDQIVLEHLPSGSLNIQFRQPDGLHSRDILGSPTKDGTLERPENS